MITVESGSSRSSTFGSVIAATIGRTDSRPSNSGLPSTNSASTASNWSAIVGAASSRSEGSTSTTTLSMVASRSRTSSSWSAATRLAITAITLAWWAVNSSTPASAAARISSGVRLRPLTTSSTGVLRLAATRALKVSSVGVVMSV